MIPVVTIQVWWMVPLTAALGSITALCASTLVRGFIRSSRVTSISTWAYLSLGCSIAGLGLGSLVPGAPAAPVWEGPSMLFLLFLSAPAYYATFRDQEEHTNPKLNREPAFSV